MFCPHLSHGFDLQILGQLLVNFPQLLDQTFGIHGKNCRNPPFFWGQKPMVSSEKNFPKPIHWSTKLATLWADGGNPLEDSYLATDLTWVHLQGELTISRNTNIWMVWLPDTNNAMKMLVNLPNLGDCMCWNVGIYPRMNNMYVWICIQCIYVTCPSCDTHVEWSNTSHLVVHLIHMEYTALWSIMYRLPMSS